MGTTIDTAIWIATLGFVMWLSWRCIVLLDLANPLFGIFVALVFTLSGPYLIERLVELYSADYEIASLWDTTPGVRLASPAVFALLGVFLWSRIETLMGRSSQS